MNNDCRWLSDQILDFLCGLPYSMTPEFGLLKWKLYFKTLTRNNEKLTKKTFTTLKGTEVLLALHSAFFSWICK